MTNSAEDALELDPAPSKPISKPWVFPVPKGTLQRIFGSSQVFQNLDVVKPKITGLTVPLKVREYYHQGLQCLEKEDWEMAVLFFSRALHLDSELVDFYALRAEAYIQLCDFSSAAQNLRRAYSFQPENSKYLERLTLVLYLQGQCLFEQCAFQEALRVFSQASALQPGKVSFRYRCMACLLALEQYQDCLSLVTKEVKLGTTNADVFILRARLYNFFQKPNLCYQDLRSALLLDPKHPQAKALLQMMVDQAQQARQDAGILAVQGKLQHALQCINRAIENNPLDPGLFLFRGTMYRRLQEFDAAVEDFLKALDMMSKSQERAVQQAQRQLLLTYNDFAVHCYLQGAYQEGVLLLNKAIKDEQQEKGLYINRGDCFFQLGNLFFAEADYQQALALSPQDEGANLRMGLLQEKMGFCEQRGRQFHKAENHFSMAIQHNPQKAQYYLYRARSRQLLQNILGARLDVATVLLLNPKQPKLLTLMASLFPGMSVEDVLCSQVAHLARLQLDRVLERRGLQAGIPQGIMGQLRERELERQKARALQFWWKPFFGIAEELEAAPQTLTGEPAGAKAAEALHEEEEEEKQEPAAGRVRSLSESYLDQTSSGSVFGFRTVSTSETSTICKEYRSTSATAVTSSDSSLLRTQSSDLMENNREHLSLSHSPRKTKATQGQSQSPSRTKVTQGQSQSPSKTESTQGHCQSPSKTESTQGQSWRPSKTEATQDKSRSPSKTKATQGHSRRPSKMEVAQGQSQSPSRTKAAQGQRWSPSRTKTAQGQSWRPSRIKAAQGQGRSSKRTKVTQGQSQSSSQTEPTQGQSRRPSQTEASPSPRQKPNKTKATRGQRQRLRKIKAAHGRSGGLIRSSSKTKDFYDPSWSPSNTEATQDQCQRSSKTTAAQSWSQNTSPGYSKPEDTWGLSPNLRKPQTRGPEPEPQKNQDWPSSDADP
ncbi:tetratricopeptide repeat protein 16 [Meles meles]|uniref:tetratricopeptide repeat protein 16 n=1 Tax=Meles meles TaxID=9662 RepID=UPI001E6A0941|nr:tetratricopeptide repeat protein 16 [Meles meles]